MSIARDNHDHDHDEKPCTVINVYCDKGGEKHCCEPEFAEAYSVLSQTLAASTGAGIPGQVVLLENIVIETANIDMSQVNTTGKVFLKKAGWYDATLGVCGGLNPIPSPLPVWTTSLYKNGVLVPASTFSNIPLSPEQKSNEQVSDVFFHADAGDYIQLANSSSAPLFLTSPTLGTTSIPNSATIKIQLLKAD